MKEFEHVLGEVQINKFEQVQRGRDPFYVVFLLRWWDFVF